MVPTVQCLLHLLYLQSKNNHSEQNTNRPPVFRARLQPGVLCVTMIQVQQWPDTTNIDPEHTWRNRHTSYDDSSEDTRQFWSHVCVLKPRVWRRPVQVSPLPGLLACTVCELPSEGLCLAPSLPRHVLSKSLQKCKWYLTMFGAESIYNATRRSLLVVPYPYSKNLKALKSLEESFKILYEQVVYKIKRHR